MLRQKEKKAAIFFITAGDPSLETTLDIMIEMAKNGADCIELGMPFSDPIADGPIIQRSTSRALVNKITIKDIFKVTNCFREKHDTPVVMMGYYNPVMRYGLTELAKDCLENGVDGLIVADLPYEEGEEFEQVCKSQDVSLIYLLAPDIDPNRTREIVNVSSGFVYCVAQYSTTGSTNQKDMVLPETIRSLQQMTNLPVCVGFGISSLDKVKAMSRNADGIIIGSWLIKELEASQDKAKSAGLFVRKVKNAIS